jgi:hypothetical protein
MTCNLCGAAVHIERVIIVRTQDCNSCAPSGVICTECNVRLLDAGKLRSANMANFRSIPVESYIALVELFGIKVLNHENKM